MKKSGAPALAFPPLKPVATFQSLIVAVKPGALFTDTLYDLATYFVSTTLPKTLYTSASTVSIADFAKSGALCVPVIATFQSAPDTYASSILKKAPRASFAPSVQIAGSYATSLFARRRERLAFTPANTSPSPRASAFSDANSTSTETLSPFLKP